MTEDMKRDRALVKAFASYLRRQLAGTCRVAVLRRRSVRVPRRAKLLVVAGTPNRVIRSAIERRHDLHVQFEGTANADAAPRPALPLAIWDPWDLHRVGEPPGSFTVTAIVTTYNEAEIVDQLVDRLTAGGMRVHVVDNWSSDGTFEHLQDRAARDDIRVERWPTSGPTPYFDLAGLLGHVERVAHESGADWVLHHDADEIHESPWPGVSLRHALWSVERWGFNAIDHVGLDFRPVDNRWQPGDDLASSFEGFELPEYSSYFTLVKGWKPQPQPVDLAGSGGHEVVFQGRRVFPYKFLIRHYPIRSQDHGEKKILKERKDRFDPEERAKGWHTHYDKFVPGSSFLWEPTALHRWADINERLLVQRLSGAGLPGNPRKKESLS